MKAPVALANAANRFDRMSLRERALAAAAALAVLVMGWIVAFLDPATARQRALSAEMTSLQEAIGTVAATIEAGAGPDLISEARARETRLRSRLEEINAQLASESAGLIAPERMVQVIHDVLSRQRGVTLVSLHNRPVTTLVAAPADAAATTSGSGPYVHPVELVVEGRYLDVLAYLRALESLPWRFYWKVLELETTQYPMNRVRIELSTLSMEKEWLGV